MNPGGAERPSWDSLHPARGARGGCRLSFTLGAPVASLWCAPAAARRGEALGLICSTSGALAALWLPSRVSPPAPLPRLASQGSGREGGVSGAGGRDRYKSVGGAPAQASLAALCRDEERRGQHGPWRGRCARATQCVD